MSCVKLTKFSMALLLTAVISCGSGGGATGSGQNSSIQCGVLTGSRRVLQAEQFEKGNAVYVSAARREWESFQILLRSDSGAKGITLEPGDLHGPDGSTLAGQNAVLYRMHHLHITSPSTGNDTFQPGYYPDALIPFRHPVSGQSLTGPVYRAVPFDLPADQTHGFWVDLFVPADTPAGRYAGTYKIKDNQNRTVAGIDVVLTVRGFSLPQKPFLKTAFGSAERWIRHYVWKEGQSGEVTDEQWRSIAHQCNLLMSQHRLNAYIPCFSFPTELNSDGALPVDPENPDDFRAYIQPLKDFLNNPEYCVNAVHIPVFGTPYLAELLGLDTVDDFDVARFSDEDRRKIQTYTRSWQRVIEAAEPAEDIQFYIYPTDEPNTKAAYDFVREVGKTIRAIAPRFIKVLVTEQVAPDEQFDPLDDGVDIWCPTFGSFDPGAWPEQTAKGKQYWTYTALADRTAPVWQTDQPLVRYRLPAWAAWNRGIRGLLYWNVAWWGEETMGGDYWRGHWEQPLTYRNHWQESSYDYNGEGLLVYSARPVGYDAVVPSIRLKAIRDGIEDYDYLMIAYQLGLEEQARQICGSVAPVFKPRCEDASQKNCWHEDAGNVSLARDRLAVLIEQALE